MVASQVETQQASQSTQQNQLEKVALQIPFTFFKVWLPDNDIEARRKVVNKYNRQVVLIATEQHVCLNMGQIRVDPKDEQCYYFRRSCSFSDRLEEERLWYNDIEAFYRGGVGGVDMVFFIKPFA